MQRNLNKRNQTHLVLVCPGRSRSKEVHSKFTSVNKLVTHFLKETVKNCQFSGEKNGIS